jgi:hypothetical protein
MKIDNISLRAIASKSSKVPEMPQSAAMAFLRRIVAKQ